MSDDTRERIIEGVLQLLQSTAARDISMETLADWTGVSRKTIYNHFSGKGELMAEAIATGMERIIRGLTDIAENAGLGFLDKLDLIVERGFRETRRLWTPERGYTRSGLSMEIFRGAGQLNAHLAQLIQQIVSEASTKGLLASHIEPRLFAEVILNMVRGIRCTHDTDSMVAAPLELLKESLRICLVGALSPLGAETLATSRILATEGDTP
jgi:AcrR family transcriptional regulator